jgi:hypothetical protein
MDLGTEHEPAARRPRRGVPVRLMSPPQAVTASPAARMFLALMSRSCRMPLATAALEVTEVELVIASMTCADCAVRV